MFAFWGGGNISTEGMEVSEGNGNDNRQGKEIGSSYKVPRPGKVLSFGKLVEGEKVTKRPRDASELIDKRGFGIYSGGGVRR